MQCINSGLPSGDIVSDANALLHSSSAARFGGSNDMNTILGTVVYLSVVTSIVELLFLANY
jgi:hypothetical protein